MTPVFRWYVLLMIGGIACAGCVPRPTPPDPTAVRTMRERAEERLFRGLQYRDNPVVRVQAVEALGFIDTADARAWLRSALLDEHPAVRFAACVELGRIRDELARASIERLAEDADPSVRVGALYALHRLGDDRRTGRLTYYLLHYDDITVRRNAALVLGLFVEPGVVRMLARVMKDPDPGVQLQALEGMARHGLREAIEQLQLMANSGVGSEETVAVAALGSLRNPILTDFFRYKLTRAEHVETRLTAARALGMLGIAEGLPLALEGLVFNAPRTAEAADAPAAQILRIRQLAAAALGAIGDPLALPPLERMMNLSGDPRIEVSAALAIVRIASVQREEVPGFPVIPGGSPGRTGDRVPSRP